MSGAGQPRTLVLSVRLHDRRYHGLPEWPPAPARLFQALVAGAGLAGPLGPVDCGALRWLEGLPAPVIAAPRVTRGTELIAFVPNNNLDAVGGDPTRTGKIRDAKRWRPLLLASDAPLHYIWALTDADAADQGPLAALASLVERLYQLGRGVDLAWGWAEVLDGDATAALLSDYPGEVHRPSASGAGGRVLPSPHEGSLESLTARHRANAHRFAMMSGARTAVFSQPPRPSFGAARYDGAPSRRLYELFDRSDPRRPGAWDLVGAVPLTVAIRDAAIARLSQAIPDRGEAIEQAVRGRRPDGSGAGPIGARVRILPLPSLGHEHADLRIRRVLVEVPVTCPLRPDDVFWAFSGLEPFNAGTGELLGRIIVPASTDGMTERHYGVGTSAGWHWRTVTPAALPRAVRGRGAGREEALASAVEDALRHAGLPAAQSIAVQREPFQGHGARAEDFAEGTRFGRDRVWHVEIAFRTPVAGPVAIGDGRFLGLGLMAPATRGA